MFRFKILTKTEINQRKGELNISRAFPLGAKAIKCHATVLALLQNIKECDQANMVKTVRTGNANGQGFDKLFRLGSVLKGKKDKDIKSEDFIKILDENNISIEEFIATVSPMLKNVKAEDFPDEKSRKDFEENKEVIKSMFGNTSSVFDDMDLNTLEVYINDRLTKIADNFDAVVNMIMDENGLTYKEIDTLEKQTITVNLAIMADNEASQYLANFLSQKQIKK